MLLPSTYPGPESPERPRDQLWRRRLILPLVVLVGFLVVAAGGYYVIEDDYGLLDSVYMTVITVATVGYGEVGGKLSSTGRLWSIIVIVAGMVIVAVTLSGIVAVVVEGRIRDLFGRKTLQDRVAKLTGHVIVCGYGRMGAMIAGKLMVGGRQVVVVDGSAERAAAAEQAGLPCILGDAQEEGTLQAAGVGRAEALVATLADDAGNVFVTLSAREANRKLRIIARAQQESSEDKLRKAGATSVVCPHIIGAGRMAQVVLRPAVVDFVEMAQAGEELEVDQLHLAENSPLVGKTIRALALPARIGVHIVAVRRADGAKIFHPTADMELGAGDTLILLGAIGAAAAVESAVAKVRGSPRP